MFFASQWYVRVNVQQPETRIGRRQTRDFTKISSCWVNATSRQGIQQLRISFGPIFVLFSHESSPDHVKATEENPRSPPLNDSPAKHRKLQL